MFVPIKKLVPSYLKVSSPFNVVPPSLVMTLFPEALLIVTCDGNEVKFAPLIAGNVPVKFAAGRLVKFAPDPTKLVAVTTPTVSKP